MNRNAKRLDTPHTQPRSRSAPRRATFSVAVGFQSYSILGNVWWNELASMVFKHCTDYHDKRQLIYKSPSIPTALLSLQPHSVHHHRPQPDRRTWGWRRARNTRKESWESVEVRAHDHEVSIHHPVHRYIASPAETSSPIASTPTTSSTASAQSCLVQRRPSLWH